MSDQTAIGSPLPCPRCSTDSAATGKGIAVYHGLLPCPKLPAVQWSIPVPQTPHECPCCDGWGKRKVVRLESCPACSGSGIVWGTT